MAGFSVAHVFADPATAYALVFRQSILGVENYEVICRKLEDSGFQHEQILECLGIFQDPDPMQTHSSPHLLRLMQNAHKNAWFNVEFLSGVLFPKLFLLTGTPPGLAPADVLFCAIVARLLLNLKQLFIQNDLSTDLNCENDFPARALENNIF